MNQPVRCRWAQRHEIEHRYHDTEWGVPVRDDQVLFEFLTLEGAQAGLSWLTILNKREGYHKAFAGFDPAKVARFTPAKQAKLKENPEIVRNGLKIASTVGNAKAFIKVQEEFGSFANYYWGFVENKPIINHWEKMEQVPATTPLSDTIGKDLKKRGFKFVGSTIIYSMLQATGVINDHTVDCFRHKELSDDES